MATLLEIADELYGLPLSQFTPRRDALAKELKAERDLAAGVKKLRKPSVAAWVVNLLVRREAEQVDQVLTVGAALRDAQASMDGEELRALTRQRRQLTAAVTTRARSLASGEGQKVTSAVADQVEATLTAAMIDARSAEALRSGLLITALSATGLPDADDQVAAIVAVPEALGFSATPVAAAVPGPPDLRVVADPDADAAALAEAEAELAAAEETLESAVAAAGDAAEEAAALEARSLEVQSEIDELRRRMAEAETRAEEIEDELADAEEVRAEADDAVRTATGERDRIAARVARLRG